MGFSELRKVDLPSDHWEQDLSFAQQLQDVAAVWLLAVKQ